MATILLPPDFKEFLRLLNSHEVEYLVIGGYAVNYHGYPRATGDIDIWMGIGAGNAEKMAAVLREFGFPRAAPELFTESGKVVRNRVIADMGGVPVNLIGMEDLRANKKASGRLKDLADLEQLD
jgi:hypothetical protein